MSPTKASSGKTPNVKSGKPKRLYLIRHGESLGQTAKHNGLDRKTDPSLLDAGLSHNGIAQAKRLALDDRLQSDVELVVSSPLTRALHTAVLGFGMSRCEIVVQYDLRELGSRIPENTPRNIQHVLKDVKEATELDGIAIDYTTFMPDTWPVDRYDGKATKTNSILRVMKYLYEEREEETIAVVCHYNVIREIICDEGKSLRPVNADPIVCTLYHNGEVRLGNKQTTG
eukprot:CAMPEP_0178921030 /NCGR_PEP_ID=MMETSP0786-20121207/15327_1 /TAXON_ID=186022 /ORGANISM="Thalassionema frauenfeldii, Strain CCMP 1798" /LENGTH=227 /DNA_ID=CAMNT_0020595149 /DNA_START=27 /DNA_END=710 /DNA_ORIENTATION=-